MSIVIENLSKSYGPVRALQNVSCTWEPGKLYGLLGRNGAGKSTLLSAVTQRLFPDGGSVTVDGEPIGDNDRALSKMYLMSEKLYYPETMRVKDAFRWSQAFYPNFDREFAWNLAGAFQLNTSAKVSKLSTGYSSIFKIVVALSTNAALRLLDEPVLGLDANHRDLFYKTLLARYAERPFTAVISTHLIEEISHLIEDVVILHHGQVLAQGPREELLAGGYTVSGPKGLVEEYIRGKRPAGGGHFGRPAERPSAGPPRPGRPAPGAGALPPGFAKTVRADDQRPGTDHRRVPQNMRRRGMKLKQSIRYQLADFIGPVIVYYGIVAAVHVVLFLAWIFTPATIHLGGGLTVFSGLFLFICGLCSFHDNLPMHLQNGVSRKTMYTAWLVVTVIVSASMAAADTVLATLIDLLNLPIWNAALDCCSSLSLTWKAWALGPPLSTRCSPSPSALCCWRC